MNMAAAKLDVAVDIEPTVRQAVDDLIVDYAHTIDDGLLESWPDFFTADGRYKIISRENFEEGLTLGIVSCEGQGMMRDRIKALRDANIYEPHTYCHLLGRTTLARTGDDFRARTNFTIIRTMQTGREDRFATGKYLDDIVLEEGRPKLRARTVVLESRRIDILLVIPM